MNKFIGSIGSNDPFDGDKPLKDETTGLFVSLYLIVLAFFVVMNSISNQDQNKVSAATESVTRAFKNPFEPEADFVDVSANQDALTPNDEFYDQILGVFASLVGFDGKFPTKGGNVVKINFEPSKIFEKDSNVFRPNQQAFLQQLAGFLKAGRDSEKREIDIVISSGKGLPKGPEYWKDITILRAGAFVYELKKMGVAEDKLAIGVVQGKDDMMVLTFYNRERKNIRQRLTGHETQKLPATQNQENPKSEPPKGTGL
ncbi:MAG: flagellar motor protein MotB [Emcibacter sp.]|nr:flagellar motor protein MotB [Emcibacter sp.]